MNRAALPKLPPDIEDRLRQRNQVRQSRLDMQLNTISQAIAKKRDLAVNGRRASGIEAQWLAAEEAYIGIDDANRHEFGNAKWAKPTTMSGGLLKEGPSSPGDIRSTVFIPVTARYVDAGSAKVAEILLPPDDKAFSFRPTPVPELINAKDDTRQVVKDGIPLERDPRPGELPASLPPTGPPPSGAPAAPPPPGQAGPPPMPGAPPAPGAPPMPGAPMMPDQMPPEAMPPGGMPPGVPLTVKDLAEENLKLATDAAEKAEKRVWDWHVEGRYQMENRKVIFDASKLGVGVLRGPYPVVRRKMSIQRVEAESEQPGEKPRRGFEIKMVEKIVPSFKRVDPWNFYPDPNCGEDIKSGNYCIEHDRISERTLRSLIQQKDYLEGQIRKALKEGPGRKYMNTERPSGTIEDERYDIWYFEGTLTREELAIANPTAAKELPEDQANVFVWVEMVNDTVIKVVPAPLDSGQFDYHSVPWRRREGHWAGVGVAEQIAPAQRIINAATRAMLDNAGVAAGIQLIMDQRVTPADGNYVITRNKVWHMASNAMIDDVRKAFTAVTFPNMEQALLAIIEYGFRLAEESTNIPLITQGQSGKNQPETLGGLQLQDTNANQLLRSIAHAYDDHITEPVVQLCYEWLLLDPDVPDDEKGDFDISANGSASLVERAIQDQTIAQLAAIVTNPEFGINPRRWLVEYLKSKKLDVRKIEFTDEEKEHLAQQPPPKAPQVQAAEIRAQADLKRAEMDTDRDQVYVQAETERTRVEAEIRMMEMKAKIQLAMLDYANKRNISLEQVKADLAATTMKLQVQRELAAQDRAGEALTPPTEPPGRAPKGQSFEK